MLKTTFFKLCLPLIAVSVLTSCQKNDVKEIEETNEAKIAELQRFIANSTGHKPEEIAYSKQNREFVIDQDGIMSLQEAEQHLERINSGSEYMTGVNGVKHRKSYYSVAPDKRSNIAIFISSSVPSVWLPAIDKAISNWNATNSALYLVKTTNSAAAKITISTNYTTSSVIATAKYPDAYGNPGRSITINTYQNGLAESLKVFAITHEFGHNFGLTHTNGTYGSLITGTPTTDPSSVMNSVCLNWVGFTAYDLTAIRTLYPKL